MGLTIYDSAHDFNNNWLKHTVKRKLMDHFIQKWQGEMNEHNLYVSYRCHKKELKLEDYIKQQPYSVRRAIGRFRCSNHSLAVETGRHIGLARENRTCTKCMCNKLGDEYHLLLECQNANVVMIRKQLIPRYYYICPSMHKYVEFMEKASTNEELAGKLGRFLIRTL